METTTNVGPPTKANERYHERVRPGQVPRVRVPLAAQQQGQLAVQQQGQGKPSYQNKPATKQTTLQKGDDDDCDPSLITGLQSLSVGNIVTLAIGTGPSPREDPQLCLEYKNDVLIHMMTIEQSQCYVVRENFILAKQKEITPRMRIILLDWLLSVHVRFKLLQETYQLCIDLIDRFLQVRAVARDQFQLLGVSCMHVAAKYEEIYPPTVEDYVYVTDNTYTAQQVREQEKNILKFLHYRISRPLTIQFLRQLSAEGNADIVEHNMAKFLVDLAMMDYKLASCRPSRRAAAALLLAVRILKKEDSRVQSCDFERAFSIFRLSPSTPPLTILQEIEALVEQLLSSLRSVRRSQYRSVFEKYSSSKLYRVSTMKSVKEI